MASSAPPAVPAYLLSLLAKRFAQTADAFTQSHPGYWVVWEPGPTRAAGVFDPTATAVGLEKSGSVGDSLAFYLKPRQPLKLGRSSTCDLVINDATVSREHLAFEPDGEGWKVRVLSSAGATELAGAPINTGAEAPLASGGVLRTGDVMLTFWTTAGLAQRLKPS
jgi:hypothetical protein